MIFSTELENAIVETPFKGKSEKELGIEWLICRDWPECPRIMQNVKEFSKKFKNVLAFL